MATYCFDPIAGNDGNSGSDVSPRQNIPSNLSSAGYANSDVLLLKAGRTFVEAWSGDRVTVNRTGIRFGRYGDGPNPIVTGANSSGGAGNLFRFFSAGAVFESIEVADLAGAHALYVQGAVAGFTARNAQFRRIRGEAANNQNAITVGAGGACTGVSLTDLVIDSVCNDGIFANSSDYLYVERNRISNVSLDAVNGDCIAASGDCANLRIRFNDLDHSSVDTKHCIIQDGGSTGNALIEYNSCVGPETGNNHTGIYCTLSGDIRRNYVRTARSGIYKAGTNGINIHSNIVVQTVGGAGLGAIYGVATSNVGVHHNALLHLGAAADLNDAAIRFTTSDASLRFYNNIIVGFQTGILKGAASLERNNLFYQVADLVNGSTEDVSDVVADPMFLDPARPWLGLHPDSPCWNAGTYIAGTQDWNGKDIQPGAPPIGPFQQYGVRSNVASRSVGSRSVADRELAYRRGIAA
jgi:hypothetical protein